MKNFLFIEFPHSKITFWLSGAVWGFFFSEEIILINRKLLMKRKISMKRKTGLVMTVTIHNNILRFYSA